MIKVIGKRLLIPNKDRLIGFEGDNRTGRLYFSFRKDFFTEVFGSESDLSVSAKLQAPGASKAVAYVLTPVADLSSDKESVYELEILSGMVQAVGEIKLQLILLKDMGKDENQSDIPDLEWNSETQSFYACDSLDFETYSGSAGSAQLDAFKELLSEIGAKAQIASESAAASSGSAASANGYAEAARVKAESAAESEAACNASAGTASEKAKAAAASASAAGSYAASAKAFSETAGGLAEQAAASAAAASAGAEAAEKAKGAAESAKEAAETAKAAALNAANDAKNEAFAAKSLAQSAMDASVSARAGAKSASDNAAASLLHMNEAERYSEEAKAAAQKVDGHIANTDNPHEVTAAQVGAYTKTETDGKIAEAVTPVASDITALEGTVSGKLDKVSSYVRIYPGVYATNDTDGTPHLITATSDLSYIGNSRGYIPLYETGGQLKTATPTAADSAANKGYVDGKQIYETDANQNATFPAQVKTSAVPESDNDLVNKKYVDEKPVQVKDGAITAEKLGASAVETDKLKDGAVTKTKIADGAVSESKFDSDLSAAFTGKENSGNKGQPNGYAPLDANGKLPDSYLYSVTVKQYGVRWKGTSSTVCERLGDAVGLTAKAHKGSTESVDNDYDNIYPWSDIKTCNIDADGNVLAYLGEPSFARDGTNGDVMVEIPKFYYKRVKTGIVEEIWICGTKLPGYELHPLFIDNGKEVSKVFHSVYNASSFTDETDNKVKLQSITGVQPRVRTTRANFRTYARNKGAIWGIEDISCVSALQLLYLVEYANTHSQSVLGSGADSLSYTSNHKALEETTNGNTITIASTYKNVYKLGQRIEIGTSQGANNITTTPRTVTAITTDDETGQTTITFDGDPITIAVGNMIWNVAPLNGSCDDLNGKSGWLAGENNYSDHYADVNYRGIEGFHAKLFRFIDGVNIKDRVVYYANSMADYADGVYDGKYRAVGYTNAQANGYVSEFGYDEKAPLVMFPTEAKGGSTTYVPDYYYQNTGERQLALGGNFSSGGAIDGVFCFDCNGDFSNAYSGCGAHLLVKKP